MLTTIIISLLTAVCSAALAYLFANRGSSRTLADQSETAKQEADALRREVQSLAEAKARCEGQSQSMDALAQQVRVKEQQAAELQSELANACAELRAAETSVAEITRATAQALSEKDKALNSRLEEKERSLQAQLEEKQKSIDEQKSLLAQAEAKLAETFDSLSVKALTAVSEQFMKTAKATLEATQAQASGDLKLKQRAIEEMLQPIKESLEKVQAQNRELESKRTSAFDSIERGLLAISQGADHLANALRKPAVRGIWGEMNLHTILTDAGLVEGIHFDIQDTTEDDEGARSRPDVIVHLPNGRDFIIDSKAVIDHFWAGMNAEDEAARTEKFKAHARLVRSHVRQLANKTYWKNYKAAPDCVVMYLPTEGAYQAAMESDPALLTDAHASRIYIANPMTLANMVNLAAFILKEESLRQNTHEVQLAATELYDRLAKFAANFDDLGRNLRITVEKYNRAAGSFERRVLPQGRKMAALGARTSSDLQDARSLETIPNRLTCSEARDKACGGADETLWALPAEAQPA